MTDLKIQTDEGVMSANGDEEGRATANQLLGAINAAGMIARSISAEAIKSLQAFRDEKFYLQLGCKTFDEFLDKHPQSPMSYYLFHQREELLAKEGDLTFQLLNTLRVPAAKRKLLTAGEVNVVGQEVEINGEKFPISNHIELRTLIVGILEEKAEVDRKSQTLEKTIERGKKEIEKHKRRTVELEEQLARGGFVSADSSPHARALVSLLGDFQLLTQEVHDIDDASERQRFGAVALEHLAEAKSHLETALGFQEPESKLGLSEQDENELMASID